MHSLVLVSVEGIEEVDGRNQVGVYDVGREDGERTSQSGETVPEKLRTEESENGNSVVGSDVVVN